MGYGIKVADKWRHRSFPGGVLVLGSLLFVVIALAVNSTRSKVIEFLDIKLHVDPPPNADVDSTPIFTEPPRPSASQRPKLTYQSQDWLSSIFLIVLVTLGIALFLLLVFSAMALWSRRRKKAETIDNLPPVLSRQQAAAAFQASRFRFDEIDDAAHAVVAAWKQLEVALAGYGIKRGNADTTETFVQNALAHLDLDAAALRGFADLFRQARFGQLDNSPTQRQQAETFLRRLAESLRGGDD